MLDGMKLPLDVLCSCNMQPEVCCTPRCRLHWCSEQLCANFMMLRVAHSVGKTLRPCTSSGLLSTHLQLHLTVDLPVKAVLKRQHEAPKLQEELTFVGLQIWNSQHALRILSGHNPATPLLVWDCSKPSAHGGSLHKMCQICDI